MSDEKKRKTGEERAHQAEEAAGLGFLSVKTGDFSEAVGIHLDSLHDGKRGLYEISQSKVHPDYRAANLKQQAGFSAEVKEAVRTNADRAFHGDSRRVARTDDLGSVNDPLTDIAEVGGDGRAVPGSGVQMKFVGDSAKSCADKLVSAQYAKYVRNGVPIMVPSNLYDGTKQELQQKIDAWQKQINHAQAKGNSTLAKKLCEKQQHAQQIKDTLQKSRVSSTDAMEARLHPERSVYKDALGKVHAAGVEGAKSGAAISGSFTAVQHLVRVASGEEKPSAAAVAIGKTAGKAAVVGYGKSVASTGLATAMRQSGVKVLQSLSKSGLPAAAVSLAVSSFSSIASWMCGEITAEACLKAVGRNGTSLFGGAGGAALGQAVVPIPVVGAILGSIIGSALSGFAARITLTGIERAEAAEAHQRMVHAQCEAYIQQMNAYRAAMNQCIQVYLQKNGAVFNGALDAIQQAMHIDDVEVFISGANRITTHLGGKPPIKSMDDLDRKMADDSFTFQL